MRLIALVSERHGRHHCTLGLVVNLVVLWNTVYMDVAVRELRAEGYEVRMEDVAQLSPLGHKQVNMLGRYAFTEAVARVSSGRCATRKQPGRTSREQGLGFLFCRYSDPKSRSN